MYSVPTLVKLVIQYKSTLIGRILYRPANLSFQSREGYKVTFCDMQQETNALSLILGGVFPFDDGA